MARRHGTFYSVMKAGAPLARQHAAAQRRNAAASARAERERARLQKVSAALARGEYMEGQAQEAEALNDALAQSMEELKNILPTGVNTAGLFDFAAMKRQVVATPFQPGDLAHSEPTPSAIQYMPTALTGLNKFLPSSKRAHEKVTELAHARFDDDIRKHAECEAARKTALANARSAHEQAEAKSRRECDEWNAQVDQFASDYAAADPTAIADHLRLVLEESPYPEGFPQAAKTAFIAESKQLVVEYECPTLDTIPEHKGYKYVKSKNQITATALPAGQRRALYASVIAQVTLRTLYELFVTDTRHYVESIVFNGHVTAIDKGTGQSVHPCIVTVRTTRDVFDRINLAQVEPLACLKTLSASVSPSPGELVPVRPVLEFNMADPRFVQEADVLSTLDQRPNLMELSPTEFESLITNLFEKMGLETRQTQASRDGGVDCVAYDPRPIFGGKVIIQAKRYKNTVGVSAVRDLYGTLQNEGASKGILVTTSGYGKAAFEFATDKPLELLSGSHLLYLLETHAGITAKIEIPEAWAEPIGDVAELL
jgi:restriction system protein